MADMYYHEIARLKNEIASLHAIVGQLSSSVEKSWHRFTETIHIGTVTIPANDASYAQTVQVKASDLTTFPAASFASVHGFSSSPPVGSRAVVFCPRGENAGAIVLSTQDATSRPRNLNPGESQMYSAIGSSMKLDSSGNITMVMPNDFSLTSQGNGTMTFNSTLNITVPTFTVTGDLVVTGTITGQTTINAIEAVQLNGTPYTNP